jgi:hypothetical protein
MKSTLLFALCFTLVACGSTHDALNTQKLHGLLVSKTNGMS